MSQDAIIVGLDVGTSLTKIAVGKRLREDQNPSIIALGVAPSEGLRRGVVVDMQDVTKSIRLALDSASKMIEEDIKDVIISLNGAHIQSFETSGKVAVSRADGEVTEDDMGRVISNANPGPSSQNKEIIAIIPKTYILDEEAGIKNPIGMNGIRLELEALILEGNASPIKNLDKCVRNAGLHIEGQEVGILASAQAVLTKKQKDLGVAVIDLGAGTTSIAVYEEGRLMHVAIIPVGAAHITNDIAIGLRTSIEVAEKVKLKYGHAFEDDIKSEAKIKIDLADISAEEVGVFPLSYIVSIIEARLKEIFALVTQELRLIEREGLLPAGVVLVGGGANLKSIADLAKQELKLPVKIGIPQEVSGSIADVDDPMYATLVGLILSGFDTDEEEGGGYDSHMSSSSRHKPKAGWNPFSRFMKVFLPEEN